VGELPTPTEGQIRNTFAGMIGVTFLGIFFTPVFFSVIMKIFARSSKKKHPGSIGRGGRKENPVP
jgi:hypothetical protein